jgi:hypothetical protein
MWRVGQTSGEGVRPDGYPQRRNDDLVVKRRTLVDDAIDARDVNRVGVVIGLRGRPLVRPGSVIPVMMMVVTTGAVMVLLVVIVGARTRKRVRMKVGKVVVPGRLAVPVRVAERGS